MKIEWKTCFKIVISVFILYLCVEYFSDAMGFLGTCVSAATPLIIGGVIAYLVNILMSAYERYYFPNTDKIVVKKSRRPVCMLAAFVTLFAIVILIIGLVVPQLVSCVQVLISELPAAMKVLVRFLDSMKILPEDIMNMLQAIDWQSKISQIINMITSGLSNAIGAVYNMVSSVFSGIVTGFLSLIFSIYLLMDKDTFIKQVNRMLSHYASEKIQGKIQYVAKIANDCFRRYIIGQCTEAVILGLLCMAGMMILQLPYASMIGALVAFTALIPVAGAYIGAGVGAIMILTESPMQALIFLIFIVVLQQLEGNLIYPRVVGSSLGLPGIWVLAAVTIGGGLMGVVGMLLGVPTFAVIYRLVQNNMDKKDEEAAKKVPKKA